MEPFICHDKSSSPIYFSTIFTSTVLVDLCQQSFNTIVITDSNVGPLYANQLKKFLSSHQINNHTIVIPAGEHSKSRKMKAQIEDRLFTLGCTRDTLIIALGGGVITDLCGFIAATYCRGVPVIYIPTSLLAMVDATIGGKTGINTPHGKNLIGTFTQPVAIFIDIDLLSSLSEVDYHFAFAEIIKHALIIDADYFEYLESKHELIRQKETNLLTDLIKRSIEIKTRIISGDTTEKGKRALLNFGHTIGHALEHIFDYKISHGHAVGIGMLVESDLSNQMGLLTDEDFYRIKKILSLYKFPMNLPSVFSKEAFISALAMDKKTKEHTPRFVLLKRIGEVCFSGGSCTQPITNEGVEHAISRLLMMSVA